jgi:hypothetical protein
MSFKQWSHVIDVETDGIDQNIAKVVLIESVGDSELAVILPETNSASPGAGQAISL